MPQITFLTPATPGQRYIPISQIDTAKLEVAKWVSTELKEAIALAEQINALQVPAEVLAHVSWEGAACHFEGSMVSIKHDVLRLGVNYDNYRKKYRVVCYTIAPTYTRTSDANKVETLKEPNQIGVLNQKKLTNWIAYYEKRQEMLNQLSTERINKVNEFLQELAPYGVKFHGDDSRNWGRVDNKYFTLDFSIDPHSGYIEKRLINKVGPLELFKLGCE
jgi:hypothetical protein